MGFAPHGGFGFIGAADFADHDDGVGVRVVIESAHHVDVFEAVDRVAANTDGAGLTQTDFGELGHGFVSQRAGTRDHADAALAVNVAGHDADLDFFRGDQTGAVGAEQQRALAAGSFLGLHAVAHFEHVTHRNAFGDADRQVQVGFYRLPDGSSGAGRRHIDHRHRSAGGLCGLAHVGVNRDAFEVFAGFLGVDARHKAVFAIRVVTAHARVELTGLAGDALRDDFGAFVDVDRHEFS